MDNMTEELRKVDNLDLFIIHHPPRQGLVQPEFTLYDSEGFIDWKEKAKYELRKLKPSKEVDDVIELLDSFNGRSDKRKLKNLKAKIHVI